MENDGDHLIGRPLRPGRAAALAFISVFILLATLIGAFAMAITAPQSVEEGQTLSVSMAGAGALTISRNGVVVASGTGTASDSMPTGSASAGLYTYLFTDAAGSETRTIEVKDLPLTVTPSAPASNDVTTRDVTFALGTNWQPEFCYVTIDGDSHTLQAVSPTSYSGTFSVADGVHSVDYKCKLGTELAAASRSLHVDTLPPQVAASSPSGDVNGPYVTLIVDTDEISLCRYGEQDVEFDQLPFGMGASYALRNTATVEVDTYGSYTYFVRCQDVSGNSMETSRIISFLNKVGPSATIEIDGEEPLKADTYGIMLETDMPLAAAPTLSYTLQPSAKRQQIALTGEGDTWRGTMTLQPDVEDTTISFSYSGTSLQGVAGTAIAEGTVFKVDAKPPAPIDSVSIENDSSVIRLEWFAIEDSDHDSYNIYRSTEERVDYTDFYTTSEHKEFADYGALASRYYYYRIAPVDEAGNIGPLSQEVWGSVVGQAALEAVPVADPVSLARIDDELAAIEGVMLDANATAKMLGQEANPIMIAIIEDMQLIEQTRSASLKLEAAATMLREVRQRSPSTDETDAAIAESRKMVAEARGLLVRRILPKGQTETAQQSDDRSVERHIPYALVGINLSAGARKDYLQSAIELQDRATIDVEASTFSISTAAGMTTEYTFIRKRITLQDPANDVVVIEVIPKAVADDASLITFSRTPVVLEQDPVVQYSYDVMQEEEYHYYVQREVSLDEVKASRTLLYPKVDDAAPARQEDGGMAAITGNAVKLLPASGDGALMLVGIIIIIALGAYYVSLAEPKAPPARQYPAPQAAQRIVAASLPQARAPSAAVPTMPSATTAVPQAVSAVRAPRPVARSSSPQAQPAQHAPQQPAKPASKEDVEEMLARAQGHIDGKRYDESLAAYKEAIAAFQQDKALEQILHEETVHIYAKLLLFKQLAAAKTAAEAADRGRLRDALTNVRTLAAQVGEENTLLMTEAKASYAAFVRRLNELEIAHAERY